MAIRPDGTLQDKVNMGPYIVMMNDSILSSRDSDMVMLSFDDGFPGHVLDKICSIYQSAGWLAERDFSRESVYVVLTNPEEFRYRGHADADLNVPFSPAVHHSTVENDRHELALLEALIDSRAEMYKGNEFLSLSIPHTDRAIQAEITQRYKAAGWTGIEFSQDRYGDDYVTLRR